MGKAIAVVLGLAMIVHLIKPIGIPGLRKRSDAWKIAVIALFAMVVLVGIRPE
jgi:hypothetical protein